MEGWGGCEFLKENVEVKEVDGFEESGVMYFFHNDCEINSYLVFSDLSCKRLFSKNEELVGWLIDWSYFVSCIVLLH